MQKNFNLRNLAMPWVACLILLTGCTKWKDYVPNQGGNTEKYTIAQIVSKADDYSLLKRALDRAGLTQALNGDGPLTVFAPNNKAFAAAGFPNAAAIDNAPLETVKAILLYHVLASKITSAQIPVADNTPVATLQGENVFVTRKGNKVSVNGANVVKADIEASNGLIHAIDRILIPPSGNIVALAQGNPDLTYLVAAVLRASEGGTNVAAVLMSEGPFTVFAPTNEAFMKAGFSTIESINSASTEALTAILTYHVIAARVFSTNLVNNSTPQTVNGKNVIIKLSENKAAVKGNSNNSASKIIKADILATNGVIHVIDQVLLP